MRLLAKKWLGWLLPGLLILAGGLYIFVTQNAQASAMTITPPPQHSTAITQPVKTPVRIEIDALNLSLAVKEGVFDANKGGWTINDTDTFFARGTSTPLIYGHNRASIFEPVSHIEKGDLLRLKYADGSTTTYTYRTTRFIKPDDVSILTENDPETIILFTCSGLFNDSRRVVYFRAVE